MNLLCEDLSRASKNRTIIKRHYYSEGYEKQERLIRWWAWGSKPPSKLILGDLPQIDTTAIGLDRSLVRGDIMELGVE